ncbi:hypothetical protein ABW19_dt0200734 [Dactylella cylindrospora]|nr:hypothetical protein ABW19_dt0200734 [Dactylella cylindrospora]
MQGGIDDKFYIPTEKTLAEHPLGKFTQQIKSQQTLKVFLWKTGRVPIGILQGISNYHSPIPSIETIYPNGSHKGNIANNSTPKPITTTQTNTNQESKDWIHTPTVSDDHQEETSKPQEPSKSEPDIIPTGDSTALTSNPTESPLPSSPKAKVLVTHTTGDVTSNSATIVHAPFARFVYAKVADCVFAPRANHIVTPNGKLVNASSAVTVVVDQALVVECPATTSIMGTAEVRLNPGDTRSSSRRTSF